jgi:hypothetical protein
MPGQNPAITRHVDRRLKLRNLPFLFYSLPLRYLPDRSRGVVRIGMVGAGMRGPLWAAANGHIRGASADTCLSG